MEAREAFAWILVGLAVVIVATHWTAAKTWWRYRNEIDQLAGIADGLGGLGR